METVVKYAELSKDFCKKHEHSFWINFTDCVRIARYTDRKIKEVEELKILVRRLTRVEDKDQIRFNISVWGHLNPSSFCDVGRLFYGVFKLWSKLQRKK